jgi:hypothetical protein
MAGTVHPSTRTFFNSSPLRVLALAAVVCTSVIVISTPASASHIAPAEEFNRTEGINPAAHSVTTHNGKVITGITFVNERDAPKIRKQDAAAARAHPNTYTGTRRCITYWHYITHGGTNTWWRPNPEDFEGHIFANGNRNVDYWNEEFLPCWYTDWPTAQEWMFLANASGDFVDYDSSSSQLETTIPQSADEAQLTQYAAFDLCNYDLNWTYLAPHSSGVFIYRDTGTSAVYWSYGLLDGNSLINMDIPQEPVFAGFRADGCSFSNV